MLSVGDARPVNVGVAVCARFAPGRTGGGRIVDGFLIGPEGRDGAVVAIIVCCGGLRWKLERCMYVSPTLKHAVAGCHGYGSLIT